MHHSSIGRTTHAAGTAGAHVMYVTRASACEMVVGEHMPQIGLEAKAWLDGQEGADRKNARVVDKIMVALPVELDGEAQRKLVERFVWEVAGKDTIPWLAAIHRKGKDEHNPHAHIILRDRHKDTGKRVMELSGKGSTERLRVIWEVCANAALEEAGIDARIDHRSLREQGIERAAQIHEGPEARALAEKGIKPESKVREERTLRGEEREINYPEIDNGMTRGEYNDVIISLSDHTNLPESIERLERVLEEKAALREQTIQERAERLAAKTEEQLEAKRKEQEAHNARKPTKPEFLAVLRERPYQKKLVQWESIGKVLGKRYAQLKERLERLRLYTQGNLQHLVSKARYLATEQVRKARPELVLMLTKLKEAHSRQKDRGRGKHTLSSDGAPQPKSPYAEYGLPDSYEAFRNSRDRQDTTSQEQERLIIKDRDDRDR